MTDKFPYKLVDGQTGEMITEFKSKTIALRRCERDNLAAGGHRFYVLKPNGGKVTA